MLRKSVARVEAEPERIQKSTNTPCHAVVKNCLRKIFNVCIKYFLNTVVQKRILREGALVDSSISCANLKEDDLFFISSVVSHFLYVGRKPI